jgi:hypothetical protein
MFKRLSITHARVVPANQGELACIEIQIRLLDGGVYAFKSYVAMSENLAKELAEQIRKEA